MTLYREGDKWFIFREGRVAEVEGKDIQAHPWIAKYVGG